MAIDRAPIDQMILDVGAPAFRRLALLFVEETRGAVVEIRRLLDAQDWRELGRQAHSLKNSTASFGLTALSATALLLERAADAGEAEAAAEQVGTLEVSAVAELAALEALLNGLDLSA